MAPILRFIWSGACCLETMHTEAHSSQENCGCKFMHFSPDVNEPQYRLKSHNIRSPVVIMNFGGDK